MTLLLLAARADPELEMRTAARLEPIDLEHNCEDLGKSRCTGDSSRSSAGDVILPSPSGTASHRFWTGPFSLRRKLRQSQTYEKFMSMYW